jgi:DNA-binding response OmpR family regulator
MKNGSNIESIVFVIEDDASVQAALRELFGSVGLHVEPFASGESFLTSNRPDATSCLLLDVRLPGMSGLKVQEELAKAKIHMPIIFLTGRQTTDDKVSGFKLGADDYLVKPFLPDELLARVESVLRRTYRARQPLSKLLRAGPDVIINPASHEVFVHGRLTPLQPAEYTLLVLLAERPGEVISVKAIAEALDISENEKRRDRVKWHVWKLRQAIEDDHKHPKLILTEPGHGYRLEKVE